MSAGDHLRSAEGGQNMKSLIERKMSRCFMNGKSCIYERDIDACIQARNNERTKKAFVIMPFDKQLDVLYQWEIAPFFEHGGRGPGSEQFRCTPERADDARPVGFIICEKICKKIQEADYIVADITYDNPNVFYELGLAAALRKKIIPICMGKYIKERSDRLKNICGITKILPYPQFDMLDERIQDLVWDLDSTFDNFEQMSGDFITILYDSTHKLKSKERYIEEYDFGALCKTAVGTAMSEIFSENNISKKRELSLYKNIDQIRTPRYIDLSKEDFKRVIETCKDAACLLVDVTLENTIANFFWLGYVHGIGGNAIPINSYPADENTISRSTPFDIRALWHIAFREDQPKELLTSLLQILEYIYIRKSRYLNREEFWKEILKDNEVSIFLGSLYLDDLGRNTIGDWDYRTATEITNYLSTSKETMKVTLESPLPKRIESPDDSYINWLKSLLKGNAIIVASADVNDLTEVALSEILHRQPFKTISDKDTGFTGYIAYKKYAKKAVMQFPETAFYVREDASTDSRGFIIQEGAALRKELMEDHFYPDDSRVTGIRRLLGQLVVAKNPFIANKWIVIISGISGPATLGIAQMLTGCMYQEFTINNLINIPEELKAKVNEYNNIFTNDLVIDNGRQGQQIQYDSLSEYMLSKILEISKMTDGEINSIIYVDVYYPPKNGSSYSNDERKIIGWGFVNITKFVGKNWMNPNNLLCNLSDK